VWIAEGECAGARGEDTGRRRWADVKAGDCMSKGGVGTQKHEEMRADEHVGRAQKQSGGRACRLKRRQRLRNFFLGV